MNRCEQFLDLSAAGPPVRGFLHHPANAQADALVLTHGAGSNAQSPLLTALADAFCEFGLLVLRCDLPFRQERPHGPPPRGSTERDRQGLRAAVASVRRLTTGRIFLGGHSYGGRQASMMAADEPGIVDALLLLSYPLHPPRRAQELRTAHFSHLQVPALFVHGTRDPFGSVAELTEALKLVPVKTQLLPVENAGHDLMTKGNRHELIQQILQAFSTFIAAQGHE